MPRKIDDRIRAELLAAIVDYALDHGLVNLSLRPLAAAVGSSPRTMLYHFGSKERLLAAVFAEIARRQARVFAPWYERSDEYDTRTVMLRAFAWLAAPRHERLLRLLFEAHGLAVRDRRRYGMFLRTVAADWHAPFERILHARGFSNERARGLAVLLVAVIRGLLLDVLATGERARAERAFRSFLAAIELPATPGKASA